MADNPTLAFILDGISALTDDEEFDAVIRAVGVQQGES
jgi:hypothetical protein